MLAIIITIMVLELKVPHDESIAALAPVALPSALYGVILLCAAIAYWLLRQAIIAAEGAGSRLAAAVGRDWKGKLSPVLYLAAIASTAWLPWIAQAIYVLAALLWVVPDRRIEHVLAKGET